MKMAKKTSIMETILGTANLESSIRSCMRKLNKSSSVATRWVLGRYSRSKFIYSRSSPLLIPSRFRDHQMISDRKDALGTEYLSVPFRKEELETILEDITSWILRILLPYALVWHFKASVTWANSSYSSACVALMTSEFTNCRTRVVNSMLARSPHHIISSGST